MRGTIAFVVLLLGVALLLGCRGDYEVKVIGKAEPFVLSVDSLEITGEVDDPEVSEVEVDGEKWTVTGGQFSGTVDTTQKKRIEIKATDRAGNTAIKTIEIK